ncbi:MAG TPA: hypothetical protein VFY10_13210 [Dehalococcoidia bacterium]|nr:hypothetical protein [Dehalococcoidia bacterium]
MAIEEGILTTESLVSPQLGSISGLAHVGLFRGVSWRKAAFLVGWEVQSHISSITLIALVAFTSIWATLPVMLVWSAIATIAYCYARERGYPSLFTEDEWSGTASSTASYVTRSAVKAWFAGFHAFAYARIASPMLCPSRRGLRAQTSRIALLVLGMTLFGVTAAEHMLRRAGLQGRRLVQVALLGPLLNVPYRVLLSALILHAVLGLFATVDPVGTLAAVDPFRLIL